MAKPAIDLASLTTDEKLELIDELWDSLGPDDVALPPELQAELDRRIERLDREGPHGIAWDALKAELTHPRS